MKKKNLSKTDIDSIDILNVIRKGKLIIAAAILVTVAAAFVATKVFIKPVYEASTKILIKEEKLNPKDSFPAYETGWQYVGTQSEIMRSNPVINAALKKINFSNKALSSVDETKLNSSAVKKGMKIKRLDSTNILELCMEHENPLLASLLADAIAETYIENTIELKSKTVDRIISSLEQEIEIAKKSFIAVENELDKIAGKENIIMLSGSDIVLNLQKYANMDMQLMFVNADIEMLNSRISEIKERIKGADAESLDLKFLVSNSVLQNLKSQIRMAELKLDVLMANFSINHPDVIVAQSSIEKLKIDLSKETKNIINAEIDSLLIEKSSFLGKREILMGGVNKQNEMLNKVFKNQPKLARLHRDIDMKRGIYTDLIQKLQESKVLKQRTNMLPDAEIIEFSDTPKSPSKPNVMKNLLLGGLLGLTIGFGMVLVSLTSSEKKVDAEDDFAQGTERRADGRSKSANMVTCTVVGEKKELVCWSKDIGRSGMKIVTKEKLQRNNILEFEIRRDKMKPIIGNGVVVWTAPVVVNSGNSEYAAGVKFYDLELDIKNKMA